MLEAVISTPHAISNAGAVNCENLLNYDKIILMGDALDTLAKRTAALS